MKNKNLILAGILLFLLVLPLVSAHLGEEVEGIHDDAESEEESNLPSNLQKIQEYNEQQARFYLSNLSFIIAFLAGILTLLTPCSLAILPAFFAYSFKEKKQLTKMTLIFFLGFMPVFVVFGLIAGFLGQSISLVQLNNKYLIMAGGMLIIFFGLMTLFGKGFGFKVKKINKSKSGIFLFGLLFALGFTACTGPILIGMLLIAGILKNYLYSGVLMLFYSLGLFVPLFLISMFFDKYNFPGFVNKINKKLGFSITNLIAGLLLISIGLIFVIYGGTFITNYLGLGSFTAFIYSLQKNLLDYRLANVLGGIILLVFLIVLLKAILKSKTKRRL